MASAVETNGSLTAEDVVVTSLKASAQLIARFRSVFIRMVAGHANELYGRNVNASVGSNSNAIFSSVYRSGSS